MALINPRRIAAPIQHLSLPALVAGDRREGYEAAVAGAVEPAHPGALPGADVHRLAEPKKRAPGCLEWEHRPARLPSGKGILGFARVDGATALVRAEAASPLQILTPRGRGSSAWVFLVSHGGGLVAGDDVALSVEVGPGAAALLTTQAETKIYRARDGRGASQRLDARVGPGGVLALLPDPVSPFAGSRYEQRLRFDLAAGASLVALDAVAAGRCARGERWSLDRYRSSTEVLVAGQRVLADALALAAPCAGGPAPDRALSLRLGRFEVFATAIAVGPAFASGAAALLARLAARPVERGASLLAAASRLADGIFLRCAAGSVEALAGFVREALAFAATPLGEDPFARRW